jgi:hypothetical protein
MSPVKDRPSARELQLVTLQERAQTALTRVSQDIRLVELASNYGSRAEAEYLDARQMFLAGRYDDALILACGAEALIQGIPNVQERQRPW